MRRPCAYCFPPSIARRRGSLRSASSLPSLASLHLSSFINSSFFFFSKEKTLKNKNTDSQSEVVDINCPRPRPSLARALGPRPGLPLLRCPYLSRNLKIREFFKQAYLFPTKVGVFQELTTKGLRHPKGFLHPKGFVQLLIPYFRRGIPRS